MQVKTNKNNGDIRSIYNIFKKDGSEVFIWHELRKKSLV